MSCFHEPLYPIPKVCLSVSKSVSSHLTLQLFFQYEALTFSPSFLIFFYLYYPIILIAKLGYLNNNNNSGLSLFYLAAFRAVVLLCNHAVHLLLVLVEDPLLVEHLKVINTLYLTAKKNEIWCFRHSTDAKTDLMLRIITSDQAC